MFTYLFGTSDVHSGKKRKGNGLGLLDYHGVYDCQIVLEGGSSCMICTESDWWWQGFRNCTKYQAKAEKELNESSPRLFLLRKPEYEVYNVIPDRFIHGRERIGRNFNQPIFPALVPDKFVF